jgi:hypothetical protein
VLESFILRLVAADRCAGRVTGEVEVVGTRQRIAVTGVAELLAALGRSPDEPPEADAET